jgi:hypothetical protein
MNGNKVKTVHIFSFLFVICSLLFASCPNPFEAVIDSPPVDTLPPGMGSFSLSISSPQTAPRTVLPETNPDMDYFDKFELVFTAESGGAATKNVTISTYEGDPLPEVVLQAGQYSLTVDAYFGTDLLARGTLSSVVINEGANTSGSVILKMLLTVPGTTGNFTWNITVPAYVNTTTASITITPLAGGGTPVQTIPFTQNGYRSLNSGPYNVTFYFEQVSDGVVVKTLKWNEYVHVYPTLNSVFKETFTDAHFSRTHYTVTIEFKDGRDAATQSVLHGDTITEPTLNENLQPGLYYSTGSLPEERAFERWYCEEFDDTFAFDMPITGDISIYAEWNFSWAVGNGKEYRFKNGGTAAEVQEAIDFMITTYRGANIAYTLLLDKDVELTSPWTVSQPSNNSYNNNLYIRGIGGPRTITYNGSAASPFITLSFANASLTLEENIILKGMSNGSASLIRVNNGTLVMQEGSKITGHTNQYSTGGAVYVSTGTFNMNGGEISGNKANQGGGVYVNNGIFNMNGGEVQDNEAAYGGGVYIINTNAIFTMADGAKISGNKASDNGGGVFVNSDGTFTVGGAVKIKDNTKTSASTSIPNNVYLFNNYITLGTTPNAPANGMEIWVQTNYADGVIVQSGATATHVQYFKADEAGKSVELQNNKLLITNIPVKVQNGSAETYYSNLASALDSISGTGTYTVMIYATQTLAPRALSVSGANITLIAGNPSIPVEILLTNQGSLFTVNTGVTLTLNSGVTLKRNSGMGGNNAALVTVSGGVLNMKTGANIKDNVNSTASDSGGVRLVSGTFNMEGGTISSIQGTMGGGVHIASGTFTMSDGEISGNNVSGGTMGGGVYVANGGTFTMNGGKISNNNTPSAGSPAFGGGVYVVSGGTFTMNDGTINGNRALASGGGVYNAGTFTMNGGTISGNNTSSTSSNGGGVYNAGTFRMSGGTITGNSTTSTASTGGGVHVTTGVTAFTIGGTAKISGNTMSSNDTVPSNIYLSSGIYITIGNGTAATANVPAPASDMSVYVRTDTASGVIVNSGALAGHDQYFYADETGKVVVLDGVQLKLMADPNTNTNGTEAAPFKVYDPATLGYVGRGTANPAGYQSWTPDKYYEQTADINLTTTFTPIGSFTGTFDGGGHTITGLSITSSNNYAGLFSDIVSGGTVKTLGLVNVNISGSGIVGAIVGINNGTVQNCYVVTGSVTGTGQNVGGIAGSNNIPSSTVTNCYAAVTVQGTTNVGGIVGSSASTATVQNCVALNQSVTATATGGSAGRVTGNGGTLNDNRAWNGILVNNTSTGLTDETITGKNGEGVSASALKTEDGKWPFYASTLWVFNYTNQHMPYLVGGTSQPWPSYIQ